MTQEELLRIPFKFQSHMNLENEHTTVYISEDGRLGYCDHIPVNFKKKAYRHYRIKNNVYKTKKQFLEALEEYK